MTVHSPGRTVSACVPRTAPVQACGAAPASAGFPAARRGPCSGPDNNHHVR